MPPFLDSTSFFFGVCVGSIFSGKKLQNRPANAVKLSTVFSRRVVQTARSADCQTCYCSADQDGVGKIQCYLCGFPHLKDVIPEVCDFHLIRIRILRSLTIFKLLFVSSSTIIQIQFEPERSKVCRLKTPNCIIL